MALYNRKPATAREDDLILIRINKTKKKALKKQAAKKGKSLSTYLKDIIDAILTS